MVSVPAPDSSQYPTWKRQEKVLTSVVEWLRYIGLPKYEKALQVNGYDHLNFVGKDLISKQDLRDMGVADDKDLAHLYDEVQKNKTMKRE